MAFQFPTSYKIQKFGVITCKDIIICLRNFFAILLLNKELHEGFVPSPN